MWISNKHESSCLNYTVIQNLQDSPKNSILPAPHETLIHWILWLLSSIFFLLDSLVECRHFTCHITTDSLLVDSAGKFWDLQTYKFMACCSKMDMETSSTGTILCNQRRLWKWIYQIIWYLTEDRTFRIFKFYYFSLFWDIVKQSKLVCLHIA